MNKDDIIRMAREAGLMEQMPAEDDLPAVWLTSTPELERFAALVAASERDACIKACDSVDLIGADDCIAAIRERGQE